MNASERESGLARYAMRESLSLGRRYEEPVHPYRGLYQRDRDRILHASAFRRLTAKTQVLVAGTNDHHRTRLTHTLEVSQVSRTIARELRLNEDLTEAIALAHDLGHPPFGHAGESALNACMKDAGGFEHNRQGLRIVEELEQRYPHFPGLNLTWEVRESLAFHSKSPESIEVKQYREGIHQPTLEAQIVDAADSMVYDVHDLDDAFGMQLIDITDVNKLQTWQHAEHLVMQRYGTVPRDRLVATVLRQILANREQALLQQSISRLEKSQFTTAEQVKQCTSPVIEESVLLEKSVEELRAFLHEKVYHHHKVLSMTVRGRTIVEGLYQAYCANPAYMPEIHAERSKRIPVSIVAGDYLAGMTDRLAEVEHRRLFQSNKKSDMMKTSL